MNLIEQNEQYMLLIFCNPEFGKLNSWHGLGRALGLKSEASDDTKLGDQTRIQQLQNSENMLMIFSLKGVSRMYISAFLPLTETFVNFCTAITLCRGLKDLPVNIKTV